MKNTLATTALTLALSATATAFATLPAPAWAQAAAARPAAAGCPALLNQSFPRLQDEKPQSLCQYAGKVLLVVNTASFCGFTPQYEGLEALNAKYAARGLVVLGFPSNDFGQQEPGDGKAIAEFCSNTFGVKFPMFAKSSVKGPAANPLFMALSKATGKAPGWNFHKYIVGRDGQPVGTYDSNTLPTSPALVGAIEKALGGS
jgi:glutathione peroxidase